MTDKFKRDTKDESINDTSAPVSSKVVKLLLSTTKQTQVFVVFSNNETGRDLSMIETDKVEIVGATTGKISTLREEGVEVEG